MDSRGAPERVRGGQACNQGLDLGADGRATSDRPAGEFGPVLAEAATLPPQDGLGSHDHESSPPPGPHPGQPGPEEPVAAAQLRPGRRLLIHGELVVQREILKRELVLAAAEDREESKQVEQEGDH